MTTTYRLTEHHTGGTPTRGVPSTAELQPEGFVEIPPELAKELEIETRDWVVLTTARGAIETRALVTERLAPFEYQGQRLYQIGLPWHYGWTGYATGEPANVLTAIVGDPNTSMHENKALTCGLRRGRLRRERHHDQPPARAEESRSILAGPFDAEAETTAGVRIEPERTMASSRTPLCA